MFAWNTIYTRHGGFGNDPDAMQFTQANQARPSVRSATAVEALIMKGRDQRAEAVPHDLNTNADQQKRGEPYDHDHSVFSDYASE